MKNLSVIDGHNFLWRSFSVPFKFYSKKGTPLQVVSTYLKLIRRTVQVMNDLGLKGQLVVVFDTDTPNSNFELLADYKGNRKCFSADEENPYEHLPIIKKVLTTLGISYLEIPFAEADDVIATIVTKFNSQNKNYRSLIFSSDSDFYQLLGKQTRIVKIKPKDEYEVIDATFVKDKLGIEPKDYVFYKSLVGDHADNIKGIRGVGPITARKIVNGEVVFDLDIYQDLLELNKKLITLDSRVLIGEAFLTSLLMFNQLTLSNKQIFDLCEF